MTIDADQSRMARAAIAIDLAEISEKTGLSITTISEFERRETKTRKATRKKLAEFLGDFVIFLDAKPGEHGAGVLLKPGMTAKSWEEGKPRSERSPRGEGGAQLLAYWKSRPEDWASLPEGAKASTLVAIFGEVPKIDPFREECRNGSSGLGLVPRSTREG